MSTDDEWVIVADHLRCLDVVPAADFARVWAAAAVPIGTTGEGIPREAVRMLIRAARKLGTAEVWGALTRSRGSVTARHPDGRPFTGGVQ